MTDNKKRVTLFAVNDFLSRLEPFEPFIQSEKGTGAQGGLARIGQVLQLARKERPGQVLAFVAGLDFCGPAAERYEGKAEMAGLEAAGFSGAVPGIHEFEYGPEKAGKMLRQASFPIISSNLVARHAALDHIFVADAVYDTAFARVGVFGLSMAAPTSVMADGPALTSGDYFTCAQSAVTSLQEKGCDIIVAVTHIGLEEDKRVASHVAGIHAIFGAHSHSLTPDPAVIEGPAGWRTLVMQAGTGGALLGRLDLVVENHEVNEQLSRWMLQPINDAVVPLPAVTDILAPFIEGVQAHLSSEVATIQNALDARFDSMLAGRSTMGNLVADAFRWRAGTDAGMVSASLIQGNCQIPEGMIKLSQLYQLLPFSNALFTYVVTGRELSAILELSARALVTPEPAHPVPTTLRQQSFLQVSGLEAVLSVNGALLSAAIEREGTMKPLDPSARYTIAGPSWFCHGGDGYDVLAGVPCWNTGYHDVQAVADYLRKAYMRGSESVPRISLVG